MEYVPQMVSRETVIMDFRTARIELSLAFVAKLSLQAISAGV
jgi:hypothetical protein